MQTMDFLFGPYATMRPAAAAALAVALLCGVLSPLVVLRRMAFVGQGISHAAFGGVGVAAVLGLFAAGAGTGALLGAWGVVAIFCIAAGLSIGMLSRRQGIPEDTAIGVLLVASMALGFLLLQMQRGRAGSTSVSVEGFLFGQVATIGPLEAWLAWAVLTVALGALWWIRRPLLFWAFDEPMAESLGIRGGRIRAALMVILAVTGGGDHATRRCHSRHRHGRSTRCCGASGRPPYLHGTPGLGGVRGSRRVGGAHHEF